MKKLVLGPGPGWKEQKQRYAEQGIDAWGIDIIPEFEPDFISDIEEASLIFTLGEFSVYDEIEAHHIFEHIQRNKDFKRIMQECFDLLKPGGILDIAVPHKDSPIAYQCYEHVRFFIEESFMNFYDNPYSKEMRLPLFEKVLVETRPKDGGREVHVILRKPL